jgi:dTDP-4-amino-4,6-dideoxygalactose transaminase
MDSFIDKGLHNSKGIDEVYKLANEYNLRVVEDAAQAFGSKRDEKLVGTQGDIICFSFDGIKNITSGEGGAILSNDKESKRGSIGS